MLKQFVFVIFAIILCGQSWASNEDDSTCLQCAGANFTPFNDDALTSLLKDMPTLHLTEDYQGPGVTQKVLYWPDVLNVSATKALTEGQFKPLVQRQLVLAAKKHWYLLRISNSADHLVNFFMATGLPSTPYLKAYWLSDSGLSKVFDVNAEQGFYERPVNYPLLFVPLAMPPFTERVLLIEHQSLANYPLAIRLLDPESLQHKMSAFTLARGFVFGALFVFFVLFLAQCLATPSKALVFYCCYIACLMLLVGHIFGYNFAYLWPDYGEFNQRFMPFITGITYGFYFLFSAVLFDLKSLSYRLYCIAIILAFVAFTLALLNIFFDVFWLLAVAALIGLPVPVVIGWWARRVGLTSANLFFAGTALHSTLSYLLALECLGVHLGYSYYLFSFLSVGQILDLGLFSTALLRQASELRKTLREQLKQRLSDAEALAQAERAKAQMLIEQQNNALDLACATHDLNQPLAAIRFALALVDDGKKTEVKTHIVNTLNYTQELLQSMTNSGKAGYQQAQQTVDAQVFIGRLQERHCAAFTAKKLTLRFRAAINHFDVMPVVVQRILDNLLVNAARYTSKGGVLLSIRYRRGAVLLQVWDTGMGMAPEKLEQFKQPFSQASTLAEEGFGLGLFIVKSLAEQAGYQLKIDSQLGRGTCVSLWVSQ